MILEIDRFNYFLLCLTKGNYKWKAWILSCFSKHKTLPSDEGLTRDLKFIKDGKFESDENNYPYKLYDNNGTWCFVNPGDGKIVNITGSKTSEPLLYMNESIKVTPGIIPNIKEDTLTTVGRVLSNQLLKVYPFGDRLPFSNSKITYGSVEKEIVAIFEDVPENPEDRQDDKIYADMMDKYYLGAGMMDGLNVVSVPSATRRNMTACPEALMLRDQLYEKHKHELHDRTVIAKIWEQIAEVDRKWIEEDPNEGFMQAGKYFDVVRRRLYYMFGDEEKFDGTGIDFVAKSLEEGWDIDKLPTMSNSSRDGSFNRGALTALGGVITKNIIRSSAGASIAEEDCGTKLGLTMTIFANVAKEYLGNYVIQGSKSVQITNENIDSFIGKEVKLRSPGYCNTIDGNYCNICMGEFLRGRETSVVMEQATVGTTQMGWFMSKMHGNALKLVSHSTVEKYQ